ncbi:hypothetical protein [Eoetvoesiella caeni]
MNGLGAENTNLDHDEHVQELERLAAWACPSAGDVRSLNRLSVNQIRYVVTVLEKPRIEWSAGTRGHTSNNGGAGRRRRYERPLFITPLGMLPAFPERAEHFFKSNRSAVLAVFRHLYQLEDVRIYETTSKKQFMDKQYLAWLKWKARKS